VLRVRQPLIAKHHDNVIVEGTLDRAENGFVQLPGEIKNNFRAAGGTAFSN
jgi:hypothetical protein